MTTYEVMSLIVALIGVITAFCSFIAAKNSAQSARGSSIATSLIDKGMLEIQIRSNINQAANRRDDMMIKLNSERDNETLTKVAESAIGNWLNTYDEAYGLYLDYKVDRNRFKKNYYSEIVDLVEDTKLENYFSPEFKSKNQKMLIVYREWTHLEVNQS